MKQTEMTDSSNWGNLLSGKYLAIVLVMASGVLLYAMNLYFTAALMPSIVSNIGGHKYYAWVTTTFVVSAIVASLYVSSLLSWRGPKITYSIAFVVFGIGAMGNALSPSMEFLIASRIIQGFGGGLLAGLGYAVIRIALPERHWGRATAIVSAMWGVGTLLGPALGGLFAELNLWRWAYGVLALSSLLFVIVVKGSFGHTQVSKQFNSVPVFSLILLILASLAISLSSILTMGWFTFLSIGLGLFFLVIFIAVESKSQNPILPQLTYQRGNSLKWIYLTVAALSSGVMLENFIPLFGQNLAGLSPMYAGMLGVVLSLAWVIAQLFIVSISSEKVRLYSLRSGPALLTLSLLVYSMLQIEDAHIELILTWILLLTVSGIGIGLAWPLLSVAAMNSVKNDQEGGKAAAGITTIQLIAFSMTSAFSGTLMALGGSSLSLSAQYVAFGIAAITAPGIFTCWFATQRKHH